MKAYIDGEAVLVDVQYISRLKNINKEVIQDFADYIGRLVQEALDKHADHADEVELIGQALDFYLNAQEEFVSYDEHMDLAKRVYGLKGKLGIINY